MGLKLKIFLLLTYKCFDLFGQGKPEPVLQIKFADSLQVNKVDSVLLIGAGDSRTQVFLSDVTDFILAELKKKKITASYYFLGTSLTQVEQAYKEIDTKGNKLILFLLPVGKANYEVIAQTDKTNISTSLGQISFFTTKNAVAYQQEFTFQLCLTDEERTEVWLAKSLIECDISKPKYARQLGKQILGHFEKNKYID